MERDAKWDMGLWNGLLGTVFRRRSRPFCTKTTPRSPTPRIKVRLQIWIRQTDADLRIRIPDPPHLQYKMEDLCSIIPIQTIWFTTIYLVDDGNIPIPVHITYRYCLSISCTNLVQDSYISALNKTFFCVAIFHKLPQEGGLKCKIWTNGKSL